MKVKNKIYNMKITGIPILYYHSIADHEVKNEWSFLSISIRLFKNQMDYLHKNGYYTCNWKELEDHIQGKKQLPEKTVMFHFDDGFLDNWSVVFPIMKEKNFKYSIVVTPE
ncbi:MAG: deacetylase, partial [Flavobacteriaceae bacterium]|nr:deacetylase [Flavobacteriaceae bacterium]